MGTGQILNDFSGGEWHVFSVFPRGECASETTSNDALPSLKRLDSPGGKWYVQSPMAWHRNGSI